MRPTYAYLKLVYLANISVSICHAWFRGYKNRLLKPATYSVFEIFWSHNLIFSVVHTESIRNSNSGIIHVILNPIRQNLRVNVTYTYINRHLIQGNAHKATVITILINDIHVYRILTLTRNTIKLTNIFCHDLHILATM